MNSVNLIGNIGHDLELKKTKDGKSVLQFNIAVRNFSGNSDWFTCVAWESTADNIVKFFKKGNTIGINGSLMVDEYENKDGVKSKSYKIRVLGFSFCGSSKDDSEEMHSVISKPLKKAPVKDEEFDTGELLDINSDDLPF